MSGPNSRFSYKAFNEYGAPGKQESERERDANQYANAATSLSPTATMGGMAQNRYLKPNTAINGMGGLSASTVATTPTTNTKLSVDVAKEPEMANPTPSDFDTKFGNFNTTFSGLANGGTLESYQKLLEEIQTYKDTLVTEGSEANLTQLATLEAQVKAEIDKLSTSTGGSVVVGEAKAEGGHVSYEQYLRNYGGDSMKNYLASVKYANDDYYRSLMTYGMNAETLAGGGLTGAGVSSYGNDAAWAARQGAVANAGAVKQAADTETAKNYFNYVQNFKATQAAELKDTNAKRTAYLNDLIASGETNPETIKMLLGTTGYFTSEEIETYGNQIASGATSVVAEADVTAASEIFASAIEGGLGLEAAKLAVSQKYGDNVANTVAKNHTDVIKTEIDSLVSQMDGTSYDAEAKAALDSYKKQGYLTPEEYNAHLATLQESNAEYIDDLFKKARNEFRADDVIGVLGIEVGEGATEEDYMTAAIKGVYSELISLYEKGEISSEQAAQIFKDDFPREADAKKENYQNSEEALRELCNSISEYQSLAEQIESEQMYQDIIAAALKELEIYSGTYDLWGVKGADASSGSPYVYTTEKVDAYKIRFAGKEVTFPVSWVTDAARENGTKGKIDNFAFFDGNSKYSPEQASVLIDIINAWKTKI